LRFSVEIKKGFCVRACAKQAGKRSGFECGEKKPFVEFKEKFRSLDFFVSFFHQGKNENRVVGLVSPNQSEYQ
jgi:hypothetical protein